MNVPLNCFCKYFEATSPERRAAVIRQYKRGSTGAVKGMNTYYVPALRSIRGTFPTAAGSDTLTTLQRACLNPKWTDKLVDAKIAANTRVYKAVKAELGERRLNVFPNPRMQFIAGEEATINLSPELYSEVDGAPMIWKFGMAKPSRPERTVRAIIQMLNVAAKDKGLRVPLTQIRFLDTLSGKLYLESEPDAVLLAHIRLTAREMWDAWNKAA